MIEIVIVTVKLIGYRETAHQICQHLPEITRPWYSDSVSDIKSGPLTFYQYVQWLHAYSTTTIVMRLGNLHFSFW